MAKRIPKQRRARSTVDRIIRAAALIIEREGYRGLSTNAVAAKAGVGIASVYEYFDDKDDLLVAVLEREMAELWQAVEAKIPRLLTVDADAALHELFTFVLAEVTRRSNVVRVAAGYIHGATDMPAGVRFLAQVEMLTRLLLTHFGRRPGGDTDLDAFLVTHTLVGICTGVAAGLPPGRTTEDVVHWLMLVTKGVLGRDTEPATG